jgi:hypothetical protein
MEIKNAKTIQGKSRLHKVRHIGGNTFEVISGTSGTPYTVTLIAGGGRCTCSWGKYRPYRKGANGKSGCSHVVAAYDWLEATRSRRVSAWTDEQQARRQHRPMLDIGDGVTLTTRVLP